MKTRKNTIVFLVGPTSSGKTKVAAGLAEGIRGEIISCDSMQVYKGMDITTQTPPEECLLRVEHYLVKTLSPEEEFSAARFVLEAQKCIDIITGKGKMPIFAGGTGLYIKSLLDGLFPSPPKSEDFRKNLEGISRTRGLEYLHGKLKRIDREAAEKIHPNDEKRIIRALEVYELTGKTMSEKKQETKGIYGKYDTRMFGLKLPRALLYQRIEDKVDEMFERGIVEEIRALKGKDLSITAEKALGVKEVALFLDGKMSLEKAKEELKKNTRRYAKRQMTWFKSDKRIQWINADRGASLIVEDIISLL